MVSAALKADDTFGMMSAFLEAGLGGDIVKKVGAVFAFEITEKKGGPAVGVYEIKISRSPIVEHSLLRFNGSC